MRNVVKYTLGLPMLLVASFCVLCITLFVITFSDGELSPAKDILCEMWKPFKRKKTKEV